MLILFIVLYFTITLAIGFYAHKRITGGRDFMNAGRNLHPIINSFALFALWFGSETLFGASSEFAENGLQGIIEDPLGGVLCLLLVGFFYARKMYRLNALTLGDLFQLNYGQKIEILASVLMVLSFLGYIAAQLLALGLILQLLTSWSLLPCMSISLIIVLVYTSSGGMLAVSLTDFFQSLMIILGLIFIALFMTHLTPGFQSVWEAVPASHWTFFPEKNSISWFNWIASWMALGLGSIVSQDVFQRVNAARNEKAAVGSTLAGALLYALFSLLPIYIVLTLKWTHSGAEGDLQMTLPRFVLSDMPVYLQILFFGSVISAILSTCSGAILAPASLLAENIIKPLWAKNISDKGLLVLTQFSTIVMGILSLWVASGSEKIFDLVGTSSAFGVVSIFIPYTAALFFNARNQMAALLSMMAGSIVWAWCFFIAPTEIDASIYGLAASLTGWLAGIYFWKNQGSEGKLAN